LNYGSYTRALLHEAVFTLGNSRRPLLNARQSYLSPLVKLAAEKDLSKDFAIVK
jgi:hypothetical protein